MAASIFGVYSSMHAPYVIVVGSPMFSFIVTRGLWTAEVFRGQPLVV